MFFGNLLMETDYICPKASLRASHKSFYPKQSDELLKLKLNNDNKFQRTFFLSSSSVSASMCVEASLSFSFFLLFFVNIFSIIFLFMTYGKEMTDLQQRGKETAAYMYAADKLLDSNEELITLRRSTTAYSLLPVLPIPSCRLYMKCVVKPWTGYDVAKGSGREAEEEMVYVTEYGQVYHRDRSCSHISLSIQVMAAFKAGWEENAYGEQYRPCEYCGDNSFATALFITSYGDRYHTTISCRGLKRTVKTVPLSEVSLPACSKCGK